MRFYNIFEKLVNIYNLIINSDILIILLLAIIAVIILRLFNLINNKKTNILIFAIELIFTGILIYQNNNYMSNMANDLINNIFMNFYFPSIYVYLFIMISSIFIFICTIINKYISKTYKIITNIYFYTFTFVNILLINVIATNNIDIFAKESLFTNNSSLILLEISTLLFFIYLLTTTIIYITNNIIMYVGSKIKLEESNELIETFNNIPIIEIPKEIITENTPVQEVKAAVSFNELVSRIEEPSKINLVPELLIEIDKTTEENISKIDLVPEVQFSHKFIDPELLNEDIFEKDEVKEKLNFIDFNIMEKDDKLTLKDYKLFSNMLKTVIENNNTNNLSLSDILNKNLLNKYTFEEYNKFEKILNSCLN